MNQSSGITQAPTLILKNAMPMKTFAIIFPAYNEEQTIAQTMRDFHQALPEASLWVIDNSSRDETGNIARQTLLELGAKGAVIEEKRVGKGNAVRRAFHDIEADIYILTDADLTYPPEQLHQLIEPILKGHADMVVGDRLSGGNYRAENKRRFHDLGNRFVRDLVNWFFDASLVDIMSGYRVFTRQFIKNYPILVSGFEIETDMTLHALDKRFRVVEVPVKYQDRPAGSFSKLSTFRDGFRVLGTIGLILRYYRPLFFFGWAGIFVACVGLITSIPPIADYVREGYVYHVPLAILACGLEIVAIILLAIGLILDTICHQEKQRFERGLLQ